MSDPGAVERWLSENLKLDNNGVCYVYMLALTETGNTLSDFATAHDAENARRDAVLRQAREALNDTTNAGCDCGYHARLNAALAAIDALGE